MKSSFARLFLGTALLSLPLLSLPAYSMGSPASPVSASNASHYPGMLRLQVDATDVERKIFQVQEKIPVSAGQLTLLFPEWLPGRHGPYGPLNLLAGLRISAAGQVLQWQRDPVNMYAFHLNIPAGVTEIDAAFQFLSPTEEKFGRVTMTRDIVGVQWNTVLLYPAGFDASGIQIQATLRLPDGFEFGSALEVAERQNTEIRFQPVSLEQLVDSPVFAGRYFKRIDLAPGAKTTAHLNIVADKPESLNASAEQIAAHRTLVQQAARLFGSQHYRHYDFLLALSDSFSGIGLEHHESSENGLRPGYFTEWAKKPGGRDLLAHEYTHSWNGKFRRPADLMTPDFNVPMQDSLLWMYEGQTQYWGMVLAARSGLLTPEQIRDSIASLAAHYDQQQGRTWRSLQDTTNSPIFISRRAQAWSDWQREEDYYREGFLLWLEVDARLRQLSGDKRSLNDFALHFFSMQDGESRPLTYRFDDIVATLQSIQADDWAGFLKARLDSYQPATPLSALELAGWKLVYTDKLTDFAKSMEDSRQESDFRYALGFMSDKSGKISQIVWNSPAYQAKMLSGSVILAINGRAYQTDNLKSAVIHAKTTRQPIELIVRHGDDFRTVTLHYFEGLRYPRLQRIEGIPDRLQGILTPLK
ncbi:M61 family metallopeptidase [Undibacterium griseum]|uniref:M61 family metallopeptidase n=1 Tax=Undibacterium griseum TaxID=2762295 RepID=A0ABR6YMD0_9BURK|nr:M61 family metallopeptidase [Undibacterium griseum]MBC3885057.1 M61 family metallopeptidase [Undibacterium griseum]